MRTRHRFTALAAMLVAVAFAEGVARSADDEPADPPTAFEYEFGLDLNAFFASNDEAWFGESPAVVGAEIDQWSEYGVEPSVAFRMPSGKGTLFGTLSVVGTYTLGNDASGLTIGIRNPREVTLEQGHLGWTAEEVLSAFEGESFTVKLGSFDYQIGSGLLVVDGTNDGGERGGWNMGLRRSFREALLLQLATESFTLEAFRLANRPRAGGTQGDLFGVNLERRFHGDYSAGGTLMWVNARSNLGSHLAVLSGRLDRAPETGFGFSAELVAQRSDLIEAEGGFGQVSYALGDLRWAPVFSYRHAAFSGDDAATAVDERFREVAYGSTDWGTWFQGELTGGYALGNGNTTSDLVRVDLAPNEDLALHLLYFRFRFDEIAGTGLTSHDWGDELDLIVEWAYDDRLSFSGVLATLVPGQAATQLTGGARNWMQVALYATYSW